MSEMTKMLHYQTSSGATGACKIYTTEAECPSPNLKVQIDGVLGYVKLSEEENNPDATPIRVHVNSSGKTLKVLKAAGTPTGHTIIEGAGTFTVPSGIHVIELYGDFSTIYLGVTPNTTHSIYIDITQQGHIHWEIQVGCTSHNRVYINDTFISENEEEPSENIRISWSPEINKITPTVTDYN